MAEASVRTDINIAFVDENASGAYTEDAADTLCVTDISINPVPTEVVTEHYCGEKRLTKTTPAGMEVQVNVQTYLACGSTGNPPSIQPLLLSCGYAVSGADPYTFVPDPNGTPAGLAWWRRFKASSAGGDDYIRRVVDQLFCAFEISSQPQANALISFNGVGAFNSMSDQATLSPTPTSPVDALATCAGEDTTFTFAVNTGSAVSWAPCIEAFTIRRANETEKKLCFGHPGGVAKSSADFKDLVLEVTPEMLPVDDDLFEAKYLAGDTWDVTLVMKDDTGRQVTFTFTKYKISNPSEAKGGTQWNRTMTFVPADDASTHTIVFAVAP